MEASKEGQAHNPYHFFPQNDTTPIQDPEFFAFLKSNEDKRHPNYPSFFSKNGLGQDIIEVTGAEPDICLEVFYVLYHTLWPQIEGQSDISLKDAWTRFIGGSVSKGSLCPPEKLITERRIKEIKRIWSEIEGENQIFCDLDGVINSILNLKQQIDDYSGEILHKKEVVKSLDLVQEFYEGYRGRVKGLVEIILEKDRIHAVYGSETDALEDLLEPKAIMMSDVFTPHWAYRIQRSQAQKTLSLNIHGRNLKSNINDPCNHRVIALPEKSNKPLVFFKANGNPPIQPEKEFMLYSLYRHLQIPAPETALLILTDVFEASPDNFYAVQASEAVLGESSLQACREETAFDHEAHVSQTIGALLTNPSDGSFRNFKYSPIYKTLISIDNDLVFKPEFTGKEMKKIVNVKSILYLLHQIDLPIPESVHTFFITLDPHLLTFLWLQDLSQKNQEYQILLTRLTFQRTRCIYQNLLPQSEIPSLSTCLQQKVLVDPELQSDSFKPQILISGNLLTSLTEKLQLIEKILLNNRSVSTQTLFEEISPLLGKYYRKLRFEFSDIKEALEALWGNKKNDIDYSYISSLLDDEGLTNLSDSQNEFSEDLIPEAHFKKYKGILSSGQCALDRFIQRHNQRKRKNKFNIQVAFKELRFLIQEGLINSQSIRDIIDFCHTLSKMIDSNPNLITEMISLLSNLPHPELKWLLIIEKYFLQPDQQIPKDFIGSSVEALGALMKKRAFILRESESQYLFDSQGNIKKNSSLTGRSAVTCFPEENPEFYLKQYPEWPGYEFASILFMRLLGVTHLPYQDLLIIKNYPVILTQKVNGDPVHKVWENPSAFLHLDPIHTTLLIISAMLINPEDGKEDNFILSLDRKYLIPIDNDHCFLPSTFQKEGNLWNAFTVNTALQTKTILFCLDEMYMSIPLEVKKHILSLDFDLLLTKWMTELDKLENKFNNLVDQDQRNKFLDQGTVLRIPFYKQFIQNIHWKAHKIQGIFKTGDFSTLFDLLKAVEPFAARCYESSFKQGHNLQTRFKAATKNLYKKTDSDGSRLSILNTRMMMEILDVSKKDLQNDAMFQRMGPVDTLELLNQLIQEYNQKAVMEQDLLLSELDDKKYQKKLVNLFGNLSEEAALKAFLANSIMEGHNLRGSRLITSSRLTELFAQTPNAGIRIRFLSLPESPLLTGKEIKILAEACSNLEYLNISGCPQLNEIITAEGEWPLLARLEANNCLQLRKLVSYSPLRILRIGTNQNIDIFVQRSILDHFTLSNLLKKSDLWIKNLQDFGFNSPSLNISKKDLGRIVLKDDPLPSLDLSKIIIGNYSLSSPKDFAVLINFLQLGPLVIHAQNISRILTLNLINLQSLDLSCSRVTETRGLEYLIQGQFPKLTELSFNFSTLDDEGLQILSKANWPLLEILSLIETKVTEKGILDFFLEGNWPNLKAVNRVSENLSKHNFSFFSMINLSGYKITPNGIKSLTSKPNLSQLKQINLSYEEIDDEGLVILCQGEWPQLEILILSSTKITQLGVGIISSSSDWPKLKTLNLSNNKVFDDGVAALALIKWHLLENLNLSHTKLSFKGVEEIVNKSKWLKLKYLNLSNNKICDEGLSALAFADWPLLEEFDLNNTEITSDGIDSLVNRMKIPNLKKLDISHNLILDKGMEKLASGNWPLFRHLVYSETKVTLKGNIFLLENLKWPNLNLLEHSIHESFYNCTEDSDEWSPPEIILAMYPNEKINYYRYRYPCLAVTVLDMNWLNSKEIEVSITKNNEKETIRILPRDRLIQLESMDISLWSPPRIKPLQSIVLPSNLRRLQFSESSFSSCHRAERLLSKNCNFLEDLRMPKTSIKTEDIEILIARLDCPNLKKLNLSNNHIQNEGFEVLVSANWQFLEDLSLKGTKILAQGLEILTGKSNWPNLKKLDLSNNSIQNEGCKILISTNWQFLEDLSLRRTKILVQGLEILIEQSNWPKLKKLDLSSNSIQDEGLERLASAPWSQLESLYIQDIQVTNMGIENMVSISKWPNLKVLDISSNMRAFEGGVPWNIMAFGGGFRSLAFGKWPSLECLVLRGNDIRLKYFETLVEKASWPHLKVLDIGWNWERAEDPSRKLFSKKWPDTKASTS